MEGSKGNRWPRIIVHADMDAFFAAVEELDDPTLRGRPLLIGGQGPRSVVATASYAARRFGVGSAMSMEVARQRCPQALVIPPRFSRYQEISRQVMEVFESFTPIVEPLSLDEAFLDMSAARALFGSPNELGRRIKARVFEATGGLKVSVGVAPTKFAAKVASDHRKPDGLMVVHPQAIRAFLDPLPLRRLWGVGPVTEEKLRKLGLRTIGDVAAASADLLESSVGRQGPHLIRLAQGDDPRAVVPQREARSVGSEETLDVDVIGPAAIAPHLLHAADEVAARLRKNALVARGVRVKLKTSSFQIVSRQTTLHRATDNAGAIHAAALALLPSFPLDEPIRLVGVTAFELGEDSPPIQGELFATRPDPRSHDLDRTMDRVRSRFGKAAIRRASDLE